MSIVLNIRQLRYCVSWDFQLSLWPSLSLTTLGAPLGFSSVHTLFIRFTFDAVLARYLKHLLSWVHAPVIECLHIRVHLLTYHCMSGLSTVQDARVPTTLRSVQHCSPCSCSVQFPSFLVELGVEGVWFPVACVARCNFGVLFCLASLFVLHCMMVRVALNMLTRLP